MTSIHELLAETSKTDSTLLNFYETADPVLMHVLLKDVPSDILHKIAVICHGTMISETEWMKLLCQLGLENFGITWIKLHSKLREELPIYLALRGPLRQKGKKLGDIVKVMITNERLDVLYGIKIDVEKWLKETALQSKISFFAPENKFTEVDRKVESRNETVLSDEVELEKLKQYSTPMKVTHNLVTSTGTRPFKKPITVFIMHADTDTETVLQLTRLLDESKIIVRTLSDLDYLLMYDSSEAIISLLKVVDFIVPVVSETFLEQIHPNQEMNSNIFPVEYDSLSNDSCNHYLYQLILQEYLLNRCLNFRVRPVLVPTTKRQSLKFDPLLWCSLQLWKEVPKLIQILIKTKQKLII